MGICYVSHCPKLEIQQYTNEIPTLIKLLLGTREKLTSKYLISELATHLMRQYKAEGACDGEGGNLGSGQPPDKVNRTTRPFGGRTKA